MQKIVTLAIAVLLAASACSSTTAPTSPVATQAAIPTATDFVPAPVTPTEAPASPPEASPAPSPEATVVPTPTSVPTATLAPSPAPSAVPSPSPQPTPAGGLQVLQVGHRDVTPDVPDADLRKLVRGNSAFALDLYRQLRKTEKGNIVYGPYSISVAFGMQHAGAQGDTARQIEDVLHFTLPTDRLDAAFDRLSLELASRANPKLTISVVNRLFGQQDYAFKQAFLREVTRNFSAPMAALDFHGAAEAARRLINRWVAGQTNDRIKELIPKDKITDATLLVLVNAIYLDAKWASQFDRNRTHPNDFVLSNGATIQVPTMNRNAYEPVVFADGYQAIDLAYRGNKLSMLIVMPDDLKAFERTLDPSVLQAVVDSLEMQSVALSMPKFSIRTAADMIVPLQALGMHDAFEQAVADFYGISDYSRDDPAHGPLFISAVLHQAFIKVAEKGTEAAAATAIIDDGGTQGGEPPPAVRIDHPFLWFIRDRETGTILFMGRVVDPSVIAR